MIKSKRTLRTVSMVMAVSFLSQILFPTAAWALTGGPSQPEVESFEPIGTNQMVDPFTGNFTYNIPLMDVGGYPLNISYHSGVTMDQEASWVGLGWNINPGVINRNLRGLPDDFSGDPITSEFNMKPNQTFGLSANFGAEGFGVDLKNLGLKGSFGLGINYNTYNGVGVDMMLSASVDLGKSSQESGTAGLGLSMYSSSNDGLTINPSLSYSKKMNKKLKGAATLDALSSNVGVSINSRAGLTSMSMGVSASNSLNKTTKDSEGKRVNKTDKKGNNITDKGSNALGSSISFVPGTYIPQQRFPFESGNYSASFKFGGELFGLTGTFDVTGSYAYQKLKEHKRSTSGYGYIYSENGYGSDTSLLDFNREKDRSFTRHTTNLPLTNFTYDLFGISGQGVSGMFRSHRGDVGYVHDPKVNNPSASFNLGLELGAGGLIKAGTDGRLNLATSTSGMWRSGNAAYSNLNFQSKSVDDLYEPSFFKMVGERTADIYETDDGTTVSRRDYWKNAVHGNEALQVSLSGNGYNVKADAQYRNKSKGGYNMDQDVRRPERAKRNQLVSYLTRGEVIDGMGLGDYVAVYGQDHHIGEITVLRTDGSRYVYGIPAYNFKQKEVTFNVSGNSNKSCQTGLIDYSSQDASKNNKNGRDQFYQSTVTPPYAHSFLITALLSPDYADYDGIKGPSDGDMGNYVKFDYDKVHSYEWRVPYERAAYDEGLKSSASDDMGSYQYGEKELFYVQTIQSKTHIAVFHTSARSDGHGVKDENGGGVGNGAAQMKRLDKISLYTLSEYNSHSNLANAVPIKEVHFKYNYNLCKGINNSSLVNGGKLTLEEIYFTYGKSNKAKFSAYKFHYADLDHDGTMDASANPNYNLKAYDRWGYYKPNTGNCGISSTITAPEYPYVEQNSNTADVYAAAWSLTDIELPSGGKIEIDYESDDYGYVQDKRAMQMFKILGAGSSATDFTPGGNNSNVLYDRITPKEYLFFKLQETMPSSSTVADLEKAYFADIMHKHLYFRFLMNLNDTWADGNLEYVSGYAEVESVGFVGSGSSGYQYGFIKLKKVNTGDNDGLILNANPISRAAWNFARIHNPELAHSSGGSHMKDNPSEADAEAIFYELVDVFKNLSDFLKGANGALRSKNYGRKFHKEKSWVRLYNPNYKKLGGGVRVKELRMKDQWASMTRAGTTSAYGQEYTYELEDGRSSGVAAYEPLAGGDENPFRQPVFFSENHLMVPDDEHYIEGPFGESFFPSPQVGYSRVTVKNLQYSNVTQHATGKVVHEFYTAKDFPTRTDQTNLLVKHKPANFLSRMLKFSVKEHMNTSQGYVIEVNDMHGKPKAQWIYAEGQSGYLSGVEYKYNTTEETATLPFGLEDPNLPKVLRLNNTVPVLFRDNTIEDMEIGVSYDLINDFRHSKSKAESGGLCFNVSTILAAILPIPVPTVLPSYSKSINQYRTAVTTKVVNRFAIQTATIAYDVNSVIRTENELWDAETGEVLLTKVENEYDDDIYNLNYPSHFAYKGMQGAYQNIGYTEIIRMEPDGMFDSDATTSRFRKGDELMIYHSGNGGKVVKAWVLEVVGSEANPKLYLIDKWGNLLNDIDSPNYIPAEVNLQAKVIRSGYRNQMSNNIASVTLKENPVQGNALNVDHTTGFNPKILAASAVEYDENWQVTQPTIQEGSGTSGFYYKCDEPDPALTEDIKGAFGSFLRAAARQGKFMGPKNTFLLGQILGNDFSAAEQKVLEENFMTWIDTDPSKDGPVNVTTWLDPTVGTFRKQNSDGTYKLVQRHFTTLRLRFHDAAYAKVNYADIKLNDYCQGGCPLSDHDDEPIIDVLKNSLSYGTNGEQLTLQGGAAFVLDEPEESSHTNGCPFPALLPFKVMNCYPYVDCNDLYNMQTCNPYVLGIKGNFRPKESYAFLTGRDYPTALPVIRTDATYSNFDPFWYASSSTKSTWAVNTSSPDFAKWTSTSTVTRYDEFGNEIENKDALDIYSSALYKFNGSLPVAVANNAQYGQTAYESYEDYRSLIYRCVKYEYFGIQNIINTPENGIDVTSYESHTGLFSLKIDKESSVKYSTIFTTDPCSPSSNAAPYVLPVNNNNNKTNSCDINGTFGKFRDQPNATFKISYWVKEKKGAARVFDYNGLVLTIENETSTPVPISIISTKKSEIIEGWQKIEQLFTAPLDATYKTITFEFANSGTTTYYMDDLRIQPLESSMKSYAYNPNSYRLMAELDENNFATFYEYDEEGILVRIKKETERGIETIRENRNHLARQ